MANWLNWTIDRRSNAGFAFYDFENAATKKVAVLIFGIFCTRVFAKGPFRRPSPASSLRSSRAALENASRFLSSAPLRVRIPLRWAQKRKAPIAGSLTNQWWAMRDVRVRLAPSAPRFVAPLLACCAGKRFAFPQLRTLAGSNPSAMGPKKKGPHSWEPNKSVVGDEGFEPPALCV